MDTVLVDPYRDALHAAVGPVDWAAVQHLRDRTAWSDFEVAAIDEEEFVRRFWLDPGRGFDREAFSAARHAGYRFVEGMDVLLASLRGRVQRHLASNYPVWIEELRLRFALDELFEGVWASHHLGVRKPDRTFYTLLLERIAVPAERVLFVDDRAENCEAAENAGMHAHHFTGTPALARHLAAAGLGGSGLASSSSEAVGHGRGSKSA